MMYLFELHYQIQKGIYFTGKISTHAYNIYYSDKSDNMYWNYAIISDLVSVKHIIEEIKNAFKQIDRPICIYINSHQQRDLSSLQEQKFKVKHTESWFNYDDNIIASPFGAKKIESSIDKDNFLKIFEMTFGNQEYSGFQLSPEVLLSVREGFDNNKFAHFISYERNEPAAAATIGNYNGYYMIFNLSVNPAFVDTPHKNALIKSCIDYYHKAGGKSLSLRVPSNSCLEKWYIENGFQKVNSCYRMSL